MLVHKTKQQNNFSSQSRKCLFWFIFCYNEGIPCMGLLKPISGKLVVFPCLQDFLFRSHDKRSYTNDKWGYHGYWSDRGWHLFTILHIIRLPFRSILKTIFSQLIVAKSLLYILLSVHYKGSWQRKIIQDNVFFRYKLRLHVLASISKICIFYSRKCVGVWNDLHYKILRSVSPPPSTFSRAKFIKDLDAQ